MKKKKQCHIIIIQSNTFIRDNPKIYIFHKCRDHATKFLPILIIIYIFYASILKSLSRLKMNVLLIFRLT